MKIPWTARLVGGLFFAAWMTGLAVWTGFMATAHQTWPIGPLVGLTGVGLVNAGVLAILRTPLPQAPRRTGAFAVTLGTTASTGVALAGSCAVGLCAAPVAGFWALPGLNALVLADPAAAFWVMGGITLIGVILAGRHWHKLRQGSRTLRE